MNITRTINKEIKIVLTKRMIAITVAVVLFTSIFGGNLMSLQAMASTDNSTNVNATVNTNGAGVNTHASISEKQTARQTLRQTLQQDEMAYKQAVQTADITYKQAVQTSDLAHSQAIQDANTANNQAIQQARVSILQLTAHMEML